MKNFKSIVALVVALMFVSMPVAAETIRLGKERVVFHPVQTATKTANYTVTESDRGKWLKMNATGGSYTFTLPDISDLDSSVSYKFSKTDSSVNTVTVASASGDTIGGETGRKLINQNAYIVVSSGSNNDWIVSFESPYVVEDHAAGTTDLGTQGYDANIIFEGATANAFETTFGVVDPTADGSLLIPALGSGTTQYTMATSLSTNIADAANAVTGTSNGILFEGATADAFEGTLTTSDVTADRTWTMPDATGTVAMTAGVGSYSGLYSLVTVSTSLTTADCGKTFATATDAVIFGLPATVAGCKFTFVNAGAAGNNLLTINPDNADQIFGTITLAASVVVMAGSAGDAVSNTKGTSIRGDAMTLVGDGADGWYIVSSTGIWADIN